MVGGSPSADITFSCVNNSGVTSSALPWVGAVILPPAGGYASRVIVNSIINVGTDNWKVNVSRVDGGNCTDWSNTNTCKIFMPIYSEWQYGIQGSNDV